MTDPVKNVEIEDVLSSIRRLVSDDVSPKPSPSPAGVDRLVLTPAQRVTEDCAAPKPSRRAEAANAPVLLTDRLDPVDDTPGTNDAQAKTPEADADSAADALSRLVGEEVEQALRAFDPGAATAKADDASPEPEKAAAAEDTVRPPLTLEQKVAELEALVAGSVKGEEPAPADAHRQKIAAHLMNAQADKLDWQDYDGDTDDTDTPPDLAFFQSHRVGAEQTGAGGAQPAKEAEDLPSTDAVEADEEILRDMVTEIIRRELQGALGERITRNVRKLVRREIHRALMSQTLD